MQSSVALRTLLAKIDRKSYPAYKDTRDSINFRVMCCPSTMFRVIPLLPPPS